MNSSGKKLIDFEGMKLKLNRLNLRPCKGRVVNISGLTIESQGPDVGIGAVCDIQVENNRTVQCEVVGFRRGHLLMVPLENVDGISPGNEVLANNRPRSIKIDYQILGRVIDGLGNPIDGKGPLFGQDTLELDNKSISPLQRRKIEEPLSLGIRSIDGLLTCGKGQRMGIFAGSGVGKSVLLGEIANSSQADINVVALVGERGREVREFLEEDLGAEGLKRSVVVVATSDAPAVQRVKAAFLGAAIAEYFRDIGNNVLFMMDSLTRMAQAQREIGLAAGEPPATKGYCPSVFAQMPKLIERLGCGSNGSITGILTVLTEADDINDPVADSARSLLDGHIVLSRKLASRGHYPAIDILTSISRLMPAVASREHQAAANKIKEIYATYADAEDLINIGAFAQGSNKRIDGSITLIEHIRNFLIQQVREKTDYDQSVKMIMEIANKWDQMLGIDNNKKLQQRAIDLVNA